VRAARKAGRQGTAVPASSVPLFFLGRPISVPDQIGIPYFPVGRPINVPDQIGIPYFPVGRA
jgi:hypothetical protein